MTTDELIQIIKKHAQENWGTGGWDYIHECFDDNDIREELGKIRTQEEAIKKFERLAKLFDDRRTDIQSTVW